MSRRRPALGGGAPALARRTRPGCPRRRLARPTRGPAAATTAAAVTTAWLRRPAPRGATSPACASRADNAASDSRNGIVDMA